MLEKIKFYLGAIGALIVAALSLEFLRRGNKIDSLESELAGEKAGRVGDELKGEMNEQEKQVKVLEAATKEADSRFDNSRTKYDRAREKLRRDLENMSGDGGGSQ